MIDHIRRLKIKESLRDHCGVFGIYAPSENVAKITYFGLFSLQHRGQESAGIATTNGKKISLIRGMGLVPSVFNEEKLSSLKGFAAIGHSRYSTTGKNTLNNAQPLKLKLKKDELVIAYNGNITNADILRKDLKVKFTTTTDTEVIAWTVAKAAGKNWEEKILNSFPKLVGAYSIVLLTHKKLIGFRDRLGFKPLVLGHLNGGYVICSESCALDTIGAKYIRDVKPGEIVSIDQKGLKSLNKKNGNKKSFCLFEYVYFARPDSVLNKELVHDARRRSGELLAYDSPIASDLVVAVPDSGTSAAIGYSKASGISYNEALMKNRYIGRTFIQPEQRIRDLGVKLKFNPIKGNVKNKRIVIIDDSIVRGTTMKKIVEMLHLAGAKKIHLRICSPPIKYPCYFGVDTYDATQLIARQKTIEEIKKFVKADSLVYLRLSDLIKATRQKRKNLCTACFSGKYPVAVNLDFKKNIFEKKK